MILHSFTVATKIILDLVMAPGKIERENPFLRHEDQSPIQAGPAFINRATQFADGNSRMHMRVPESVLDGSQSRRHFVFAPRFPDDFLEPSR